MKSHNLVDEYEHEYQQQHVVRKEIRVEGWIRRERFGFLGGARRKASSRTGGRKEGSIRPASMASSNNLG